MLKKSYLMIEQTLGIHTCVFPFSASDPKKFTAVLVKF